MASADLVHPASDPPAPLNSGLARLDAIHVPTNLPNNR